MTREEEQVALNLFPKVSPNILTNVSFVVGCWACSAYP